MQRILKLGEIQNTSRTSDKDLNILSYWTLPKSSYTRVTHV